MSTVPSVLRDHREQLWRLWAASLAGRVAPDYAELAAGPLGERIVRRFVDDVCACSLAEDYEVPGLLRELEERAGAEARHRISLGFALADLVAAQQALLGAAIDVLLDALVLGELPSIADTLLQLKEAGDVLDRAVLATMTAA